MRRTDAGAYMFWNVAGMLGLSGNILADTFFVSDRLGADGLAALNLAVSIFGLINGIGMMFGIGGATRYAVRRGRKEEEEAGKAFTAADLTQNVAITETYKDKTTTLDTIAVAPASDVYVTIPKNATIENITKAVDCPESASVPVAVGDKLGTVVLSMDGEALATVDLTAQKEVKATTDEERAAQAAAARNKILKRIAIGVGIVFGILVVVFCCCRYIGYQRRERRRAMRKAKRQERLRQHHSHTFRHKR